MRTNLIALKLYEGGLLEATTHDKVDRGLKGRNDSINSLFAALGELDSCVYTEENALQIGKDVLQLD